MRPSDIDGLVDIEEIRLSPSAAQVAFTTSTVDVGSNRYRMSIWLAPVASGERALPFVGTDSARMPRWSPDGRRLAYVAGERGSGRHEIRVAPVAAAGQTIVIAEWHDDVDALEWSPDGSLIAFGAREPDCNRLNREPRDQPPRRLTTLYQRREGVGWVDGRPRRIYVLAADGTGKPIALDDGATPEAGPMPDTEGLSWFPDSGRVAFVAARHNGWDIDRLDDVWAAPLPGHDVEHAAVQLTKTEFSWAWPAVSPDGSRIAAVWHGRPDEVRHGRIAILDVETREWAEAAVGVSPGGTGAEPVFPVARGPVWAEDDLYYLVERRGSQHVFRLGADGVQHGVVTGDRWVHTFDAADGTVACAVSTPTTPPEVFIFDETGEERVVTRLGKAFAAKVRRSDPIRFSARSKDGASVDAWYMPPTGPSPVAGAPALVNIHGGPFSQYGNRFFDEFQLQAGAGFGVVYCNPRGSSGYGDEWGQAVAWPEHPAHPGSGWGGVDAEDVLAVIDEACRRFTEIDRERVGILGGSYGGYLTSWLIAHTQRFKAACSERAVNDVLALEQTSDIGPAFGSYTGGPFFSNSASLLARSPVTHLGEIETPLLIVHSEGDLRCPVQQADALFTGLRLRDRVVEMVRFAEENHSLSRTGAPVHRVQRAEAILGWFDRWLAPDEGPP